jgi:hypothetical protein
MSVAAPGRPVTVEAASMGVAVNPADPLFAVTEGITQMLPQHVEEVE